MNIPIALSIILFSTWNQCANAEEKTKPNLVVIMTDEHNLRTLSCYRDYYLSKFPKEVVDVWGENIFVKTPNIDSLAKEGAMFTNFYTSVPQCTPARASFLTGLYPFKTGAVENWEKMNDNVKTWAHVLQNEGYATSYQGKFHLDGGNPKWMTQDLDYDPDFFPLSGDKERTFGFTDNHYRYNSGHFKVIKEVDGKFVKGDFIKDAEDGDDLEDVYTTDFYAKRAMEYIEAKATANEPFAVFLSLVDPHGPNEVRSPYDTMYNHFEFSMPETTVDYVNSNPPPPSFYGEVHTDYKRKNGIVYKSRSPTQSAKYLERFANFRNFESTMRNYFGMVKLVDDKIGEILSTIRSQGIEDSTIVCFTSDHGDLAFEHGRLNKQEPFMTSAGIPMIIKYPNHIKEKKVIESAYSQVDFAPSILGIMGFRDEAESMGMEFDGVDGSEEIMNDEEISNDKSKLIISYWHDGRWIMALKAGYKLILNGLKKGPTMFDLREDPQELTNYVSTKPIIVNYIYGQILKWISSNEFVPTDTSKSFVNDAEYCTDSPRFFRDAKVAKRAIKCKWVSNNPEKRCFRGKGAVAIACPTTCKDVLPCSCQDVEMSFKLGKKFVTCSEITQDQCDQVIGMKETCRRTCGECN